jgi:hypothetical protein
MQLQELHEFLLLFVYSIGMDLLPVLHERPRVDHDVIHDQGAFAAHRHIFERHLREPSPPFFCCEWKAHIPLAALIERIGPELSLALCST